MNWDIESLRKAIQENDPEAAQRILLGLPAWPRPKEGVSTAVMVPAGRGGKRKRAPDKGE